MCTQLLHIAYLPIPLPSPHHTRSSSTVRVHWWWTHTLFCFVETCAGFHVESRTLPQGDGLRGCLMCDSAAFGRQAASQPIIGIVFFVGSVSILTPGGHGPQSVLMRRWADKLCGATVCTLWGKHPYSCLSTPKSHTTHSFLFESHFPEKRNNMEPRKFSTFLKKACNEADQMNTLICK